MRAGTSAANDDWVSMYPRHQAAQAARVIRPREEYWWSGLMDEDVVRGLIRDIERDKGELHAHEEVCAERYRDIERRFASFEIKLDKVVVATANGQGKINRWAIGVLAFLVTSLVSLSAWEAGALYQLQPARMGASAHPVAGVDVQVQR